MMWGRSWEPYNQTGDLGYSFSSMLALLLLGASSLFPLKTNIDHGVASSILKSFRSISALLWERSCLIPIPPQVPCSMQGECLVSTCLCICAGGFQVTVDVPDCCCALLDRV